jgi:hypothetical protein
MSPQPLFVYCDISLRMCLTLFVQGRIAVIWV